MNTKIPSLKQMPPVPSGVNFSLQKIQPVAFPHPYCITSRHVNWATDHTSGLLTLDAIRDAEKHGACCDICRRKGQLIPVDDHKTSIVLFIQIPPQVKNLNQIDGLHEYLFKNKATFEALGIQEFAFPASK